METPEIQGDAAESTAEAAQSSPAGAGSTATPEQVSPARGPGPQLERLRGRVVRGTGRARDTVRSRWQKVPANRRLPVAGGAAALVVLLVAGLALASVSAGGRPAPTQTAPGVATVASDSPIDTSYLADSESSFTAVPFASATYAPVPTGSTACQTQFKPPAATPVPTPTPAPTLAPTIAPTPTVPPTATPTPTASATDEPSASPTDVTLRFPAVAQARLAAPAPRSGSVSGQPVSAAAPAMSWQPGGSASIYAGIISTPAGFLATLVMNPGYGLCTSTDLIHWYPPTNPNVFVNQGPEAFYPATQIPVKKGYAAESDNPYLAFCNPDEGPCQPSTSEWYSADGIHWKEGIPAAVKETPGVPACVADESCVYVPGLALKDSDSEDGTTLYSKNGGKSWKKAKLPQDVGEVAQLQHLAGGLYVAIASDDSMPDVGNPPPGVVIGGMDAPNVLLTSKDGVTWTEPTVSGDAILAVGDSLYLGDGDSTMVSTDGCKTWVEVTGPGGQKLPASGIVKVGNRILLVDAWDSYGQIYWIGTPQG